MSEQDEIDSEILIALVETHPAVWDKTLAIYKDRTATKNAWRDICVAQKPDFEDCSDKDKSAFEKDVIRRWTNLRDSFTRYKKYEKDGKKRCPGGKKRKKYVFSDQLQFLSKLDLNNSTEDSWDQDVYQGGNSLQGEGEGTEETSIPSASGQSFAYTTVQSVSGQSSHKRNRKHEDPEEVELKIMRALEKSSEPGYSKMAFLHSLMPHLNKYKDSEFLEFQLGVLNVVQSINKKQRR